ncbi:eukaryotic translation initiation factor 6 [Trichinella spiralis]|uniref:eukaryotic translation initiation factor 6 n=1 Tax=Trichinella spiralis TaxID=6334 RepID=UPI0001EFCE1D|nr:eukaryotic translation initiation factor 6 [Trichinella spiralis]
MRNSITNVPLLLKTTIILTCGFGFLHGSSIFSRTFGSISPLHFASSSFYQLYTVPNQAQRHCKNSNQKMLSYQLLKYLTKLQCQANEFSKKTQRVARPNESNH